MIQGVETIASSILCFNMSLMLTMVYIVFRLNHILHPSLIVFIHIVLFLVSAAAFVALYTAAGMHTTSSKLLSSWARRFRKERWLSKRIKACKPTAVTVGIAFGCTYRNMDVEYVLVFFVAFMEYSINILLASRP